MSNNFDVGRLRRELSEISNRLETDKEEKSKKAWEFCNRFLNHSDLMIAKSQDADNPRFQEINRIFERFDAGEINEAEAKGLLSGAEIKNVDTPLNRIFKAWVKFHMVTDRALITSNQFFSRIQFDENDMQLLEQFQTVATLEVQWKKLVMTSSLSLSEMEGFMQVSVFQLLQLTPILSGLNILIFNPTLFLMIQLYMIHQYIISHMLNTGCWIELLEEVT